jgi:type II secretion system protein N
MSLSSSPLVDRLRQFAVPQRWQRPLRLVGYPAFGLFVALLTLFVTLPRDRLKDALEAQLSADSSTAQPLGLGMDVTLGDVGITLFSGAGLVGHDVVLRTRPLRSTDKPVRYFIDDVTVHVGLLGLLFNRPSYSFKGHLLSGAGLGEFSVRPDENSFDLELNGLVLSGDQSVAGLIGLPVDGTASSKVSIVMPKALLNNAHGSLDFEISNLVIGDGKAKLTVPGDPFLSQGLTFPKLHLGRIAGRVMIDKGKGRFEGVVVHSPDGDVTLDGYIDLRDPIGSSQLHAYLKFKPSDALTKREPTVELMTNALAATAKRIDGYLGIQMTGPLSAVYFFPSKSPPVGVNTKSGEPSSSNSSSSGGSAVHLPPPVTIPTPSVALPPSPTPSRSIDPQPEVPAATPASSPNPPAVPSSPSSSAAMLTVPSVSHPSLSHLPMREEPPSPSPPPPPPPPPPQGEDPPNEGNQ